MGRLLVRARGSADGGSRSVSNNVTVSRKSNDCQLHVMLSSPLFFGLPFPVFTYIPSLCPNILSTV